MTRYPNQRMVTVFKENCDSDFLQVKNSEWQAASSVLKTYSAFKLYLYFASNKNGYTIALSPVAINEAIGVCENTYRSAFKELLEVGYLRPVEGRKNMYTFHTS